MLCSFSSVMVIEACDPLNHEFMTIFSVPYICFLLWSGASIYQNAAGEACNVHATVAVGVSCRYCGSRCSELSKTR